MATVVINFEVDAVDGIESVDRAAFGVVAVSAEHGSGGRGGLGVEEFEEVLGVGVFERFGHDIFYLNTL